MHGRKAIMTAYKEIAKRKAIGCQHKDCREEKTDEKALYTAITSHLLRFLPKMPWLSADRMERGREGISPS